MEIFRISTIRYTHTLSASGKAARWNSDNQFVMYAGQSRALSTLESVVHFNNVKPLSEFRIMVISISEQENLYTTKRIIDLPDNWRSINAYPDLQTIGSKWYETRQSLILVVPSVIIPQEHNYIINTRHPDFNENNVNLVRTEGYFWDDRLIK